jgi:HKD family nuclease
VPRSSAPDELAANDLAIAHRSSDPRSAGHVIITVRRPAASYFHASAAEKAAVWALVDDVKALIDAQLHPTGYEVRFTTGSATAQGTGAQIQGIRVVPHGSDASLAARPPPLATGGGQDPPSQHLSPLFATASDNAIVAAVVTESGLELLEQRVFAALRAGAHVRVVTGDYLSFNQVDALRQLLGWSQLELREADTPPDRPPSGALCVRVVETGLADGSERAFHPKAWLFDAAGFGVAFVGSSNLSRSALGTGITRQRSEEQHRADRPQHLVRQLPRQLRVELLHALRLDQHRDRDHQPLDGLQHAEPALVIGDFKLTHGASPAPPRTCAHRARLSGTPPCVGGWPHRGKTVVRERYSR